MYNIERCESEIKSSARSQIGSLEIVQFGLQAGITGALKKKIERDPEGSFGFIQIISGTECVGIFSPGACLPVGGILLGVPTRAQLACDIYRKTCKLHHLLGTFMTNGPTAVKQSSEGTQATKGNFRPVLQRLPPSARFEQGGHFPLADLLAPEVTSVGADGG